MYRRNNDTNLGVIAILAGILILLMIINSIISADNFNNGICRICGGQYEFKSAVGYRYTKEYVYVCKRCGNLITTTSYYNLLDTE